MRQQKIDGSKGGLHGFFPGSLVKPSDPRVLLLLICVYLLVWLPLSLLGQSAWLEGKRYFFLSDDAMISMRYARNLVEGHGLVWNPGERVEGYTNFLWTMWMTIPHLLGLPDSITSLFVLLSIIGIGVCLVVWTWRLARNVGCTREYAAAALLAMILSRDLQFWAASGLEAIPLASLVVLAMACLTQEGERKRDIVWFWSALGLMPLIRSDAAVFSVALGIPGLLLSRRRKLSVLTGLMAMIPSVIHLIWRYRYYGELVPNTAILKTYGWPGRVNAGAWYSAAFLLRYIVPVALMTALLAATVRARSKSQSVDSPGKDHRLLALGAVFPVWVTYVSFAGGDAFENNRFFVPLIPMLLVWAFRGMQYLLKSMPVQRRVVVTLAVLLSIPTLLNPWNLADAATPEPHDVGNLKIAAFLNKNTEKTATIADFWAGSVFYFTKRKGVDMLGKCDPYIARLPVVSNGTKPGHNKYDFRHSLEVKKPDYLVVSFRLPLNMKWIETFSTGDFAFAGQLYYDPVFREHYLPYPLESGTWRAIFARDGHHRGSSPGPKANQQKVIIPRIVE